MTSEEIRQIAHAAQDALRREHSTGKRARIDPERIIQESLIDGGHWYYIPVDIAPYEDELGTFYELFSNVEEQLEEQGLDVLLVPVRYETPAGDRVA